MSAQWAYVIAAYCVAGIGLSALALVALLNLRRWAERAKRDETI